MPIDDTSDGEYRVLQKQGRRILQIAMWRGGPPHSSGLGRFYQQVFDRVAGVGSFVPWDRVAIYGTAAALAAGAAVDDCRAELAMWWPGHSRRVDLLIQRGRAQALVERVRRAVERRHRAHTPAGEVLMTLVHVAGLDDQAARRAVMADWRSSLLAVDLDPVFTVRNSP